MARKYGRTKKRYTRSYRRKRSAGSTWRYYGAKAGGMAYQAYKGVQYLKGLINVEKKYFDTNASAQLIDYNGTLFALSAIAGGDDVNNRQGNSILAKSLLLRLSGYLDPDSTGHTLLRVIILCDTMNTGSNPTPADLLQTTGNINAVNSPLNVDRTSRYLILRDKIIRLIQNGTQVSGNFSRQFFIKLNFHIKYTDTAGGLYKNQLYLILISDQATSATAPAVNYCSRVGFYDN